MTAGNAELLAGRRILLVEDEDFVDRDILGELQRLGVDVVGPVTTVSEALRLVDELPGLDAAILDVNFRGEIVFPVADLLQRRGIPFVFATGEDPGIIAARYPGFVLCRKPAQLSDIANALFGSRPTADHS